jgi:hypothetical protein
MSGFFGAVLSDRGLSRSIAPVEAPGTADYADQVALVGPALWLRLAEPPGATTAGNAGSAGTAANATVIGAPQFGAKPLVLDHRGNTALRAAAGGAYLEVPDVAALRPAQGAVFLHVLAEDINAERWLWSKDVEGGVAGGAGLKMLSGGFLRSYVRDGANVPREITTATAVIPQGRGRFVLFSWGGAGQRIRVGSTRGELALAAQDDGTTGGAGGDPMPRAIGHTAMAGQTNNLPLTVTIGGLAGELVVLRWAAVNPPASCATPAGFTPFTGSPFAVPAAGGAPFGRLFLWWSVLTANLPSVTLGVSNAGTGNWATATRHASDNGWPATPVQAITVQLDTDRFLAGPTLTTPTSNCLAVADLVYFDYELYPWDILGETGGDWRRIPASNNPRSMATGNGNRGCAYHYQTTPMAVAGTITGGTQREAEPPTFTTQGEAAILDAPSARVAYAVVPAPPPAPTGPFTGGATAAVPQRFLAPPGTPSAATTWRGLADELGMLVIQPTTQQAAPLSAPRTPVVANDLVGAAQQGGERIVFVAEGLFPDDSVVSVVTPSALGAVVGVDPDNPLRLFYTPPVGTAGADVFTARVTAPDGDDDDFVVTVQVTASGLLYADPGYVDPGYWDAA